MSQGNEQPGFWALIPASVRYDKELPPNAKLLYGEVTALSDKLGYCYAQNSYFSDLFGLSERSVTRLLSTLVDRGYLRVDVVRDTATQEVLERRIYAIYNTEGAGAPPPDKNVGTPPDKIVTTPPDKNVGEINTRSDHIPPIVPQGGPPKKKKAKSVPAWKPERFEKFWAGECRPRMGQAQARGRADRRHCTGAAVADQGTGLAGTLRLPLPAQPAVDGRATQTQGAGPAGSPADDGLAHGDR